ncbi:MAG: hypothetical protein ABJF04_16165 [Reichenbachiella sp.]|uniref:hypothetical protein n=1 Tax=Reichenbachiella sp. TaxID=2184521 RepID=UPI0032649188
MTSKTQNENTDNKPNWKLVQEKAYFGNDQSGRQIRKKKTIELAVGWEKVSEKGNKYISWSDSVTPVLPDVDGRIVKRSFEISNEDEN